MFLHWLGAIAASTFGLVPYPLAASQAALHHAVSKPVVYEVFTSELKTKGPSGAQAEVYRFDPGVLVALQGQQVTLRLHGWNGQDHPVTLERYAKRVVIHKHEVSSLTFLANQPGCFRLTCEAHADQAHAGPMEGYLVVVPQKF